MCNKVLFFLFLGSFIALDSMFMSCYCSILEFLSSKDVIIEHFPFKFHSKVLRSCAIRSLCTGFLVINNCIGFAVKDKIIGHLWDIIRCILYYTVLVDHLHSCMC